MKTEKENKVMIEIGNKIVDLLKIVYPTVCCDVEYHKLEEYYTFNFDKNVYHVNVYADSYTATLNDIIHQFLFYIL